MFRWGWGNGVAESANTHVLNAGVAGTRGFFSH
jgi:hypothetical protein